MGKTSLRQKLSEHISPFTTDTILEKDIVYMFIVDIPAKLTT
jgi:hypothetical protein